MHLHLRSAARRRDALTLLALTVQLAPIQAQSPPRPAVEVRQFPTAVRSLLAADFNRDGRLDLISDHAEGPFTPSTDVVLRLGNGNGTFGAPRPTGVAGAPVAVGDLDGDGRQDVVVLAANGLLRILPGNGDATFGSPHDLSRVEDFRFAEAGDMNGDRVPDLVIGHGAVVEVRPGGGDFSFGPPMALPPGGEHGSAGAVIADLDADGRPDLAVAQARGSVIVYLNRGGLLFAASELLIAPDDELRGIAAGDLNGDAKVDLVVPHARRDENYDIGRVDVLIGRGNGTFAAAVAYEAPLTGTLTAALGDFNRDGLVDVAVGGRSFLFDDESTVYWDSVSIFPGRGNGTLAPAAAFRLDTSAGSGIDVYRAMHAALRAGDLDGDGRLDLIATPGALLLNRPPAANRPPSVEAGADRRGFACEPVAVRPTLAEPDWDWLSVTWRDETGALAGGSPTLLSWACETRTFSVTVTDARGAAATDRVTITRVAASGVQVEVTHPAGGDRFPAGASVQIEWTGANLHRGEFYRVAVSPDGFATSRVIHDGVPNGVQAAVWENAGPPGTAWRVRVEAVGDDGAVAAAGTSASFVIEEAGGSAPPWPWQSRDIGFVGARGSATAANGTFAVNGSGSDIWNTADAFHFLYQRVEGDVVFEGRVAGVAGPHSWTKVGLMLRRSLDADSVHHFLLASRSKGLAYQRRVAKGFWSEHSALGAGAAGVTFRIIRSGGFVRLAMKREGDAAFTTVAVQPFADGTAYVGLAVTSHDFARLATGTFDAVQVRPAGAGALPALWENYDVGDVAAAGRAAFDAQTGGFTLRGSGADIWGTRDEFHFVAREVRRHIEDAFEITARVTAVQNVHQWTKAGLMIRSGRGESAAHASIFVTPTTLKGVAFQRRRSDGGVSVHTAGPAITAPVWLKLVYASGRVNAYYRHRTTDPWTHLAGDGIHFSPSDDEGRTARTNYQVGVVVSSHADGRLAEARFDHLSVRPLDELGNVEDVGAVGVEGSQGFDPVTRTLAGSGADIWGTADAFRYLFAHMPASGSISARVLSIERTHAWAKAGVMIREDLFPGSPHVMLIVSPGKGIAMQSRLARDGPTINVALVTGAAPAWVRLSRERDDIAGEISTDGLTWREIGRVGLPLGESAIAGLAVTSHDNSRLATGVFDDVILQR